MSGRGNRKSIKIVKTPNRIRQAKRDKIKFNVMVVGETGLGKTTFLHSLLRKYISDFQPPESSPVTDKTVQIQRVGQFEILTDSGDGLDIVLYDSPGFGDFVNNSDAIKIVKEYIHKSHQAWKKLDAQSMTEAEFLQKDDRIHCVFYFMAPHRLKAIDLEFIKELAPLVPIIPLVSKSDIMTVPERNFYLESVKAKLDSISEALGEHCMYDFQGDDLAVLDDEEEGENGDFVPPNKNNELVRIPNLFAVVCDSSPERIYPWGSLLIDNHAISDFRRLQTILFENELHLKGMMDETRKKSIRLQKV